MTELTQVPYLERLSSSQWAKFVADFESYRGRGGQRRVRSLISDTAMRTITLRLRFTKAGQPPADAARRGESGESGGAREDPAGDDRAFVQAVSAMFAPRSPLEAYDRFREVNMTAKGPSVDAVLAYIQAYDRVETLCAAVMPPQERLLKLFVAGLRPPRLSERVEFRSPRSLEEAKGLAVEEADAMAYTIRESSRSTSEGPSDQPPRGSPMPPRRPGPHDSAPSPRPPPRPVPRPDGPRMDPRPDQPRPAWRPQEQPRPRPDGAEITCHTCGEKGHISPTCPMKWQRVGNRMSRGPDDSRAQGKAARVVDSAPDGLRRVRVTLKTPQGEVQTDALLDSGATGEFISTPLYEKLIAIGATAKDAPRKVQLMTGIIATGMQVMCTMHIDKALSPLVGRDLQLPVTLLVADGADEDLIIGMPLMETTGLNVLLGQPREQAVESPAVMDDGGDDNGELADEFGQGHDGTLPEIPDVPGAQRLKSLVVEFSPIFGELPPQGARVKPMMIELKPGQAPKPIPPRKASQAMRKVICDEVESWQKLGIIRPSSSPYSSPVVVVKKKDGTYRPCVDYRDLNDCTVDIKFPLQNTKTVLERMAGMRVFGTIDLRSGFHQIPVDAASQHLTAFATFDGFFEFTRVQFGLKNGPSFFQQTMMNVLAGLVGTACEVFIDDIIVYAVDFNGFLANLRRVFERIRDHDMRIKGSKCHLGLNSVEYLGHIVNGDGIALSDARKQGIIDMKPPTTASQMRSFMGMANYFRSFVRNFAAVAKPLHALCSDIAAFVWTPGAESAFECIKDAIRNAPLLHHIDYTKPIILRTDASNHGIGGVLLQPQDEQEAPVCYFSKAFTPTETNWSTIEQEAFGVYYCITHAEHYLRGHRFTVETDHRNLVYIHRATAPKIVRWKLRLQEYDFDIKHIAGKSNVVADALSRCHVTIVLPHQATIMKVHNATVGHRGVRLTEALLREGGEEWPSMREDIDAFIKACPTCQKVRLGQGSMAAALSTTEARQPFEVAAIDTMGPLPMDGYGNQYLIAIIDCFTRFVELRATRGVTAMDAAGALLDVFGRYGVPRMVRSDQGTQFTSRVVDNMLALMGSARQFTIPHRPEANGIVERVNQEIGRHLRAIVFDHRVSETWSASLPLVQRIINATPHSATGVPPARLLYGDAVTLDRGVITPFQEAHGPIVVEDYIIKLTAAQQAIIQASQDHQDLVVEERLKKTPENPTEFEVGDYVLVSYPERPPTKLAPRWRGPLIIVDSQGTTYKCQDLSTKKLQDFHITRLKKYNMAITDDPVQVAAADAVEYVVEAIVGHRAAPRKADWTFRVRWAGYAPSEDTWEPYANVRDLAQLDAYRLEHPELKL